jgi:hypothetical protein
MIGLHLPALRTVSGDQLAAAEFVEIFNDDVGIENDVAVVEDQDRQFLQRRDARIFVVGLPGATVAGTNSILSINPVSMAAIRTLRANGEAGRR